jgi:hypothetical protein
MSGAEGDRLGWSDYSHLVGAPAACGTDSGSHNYKFLAEILT